MNILFDTDVLIDVAIRREPFYDESVALLDSCDQGKINGFIAWHSFSNLYYITNPSIGSKEVEVFIKELLVTCNIPKTSTATLLHVLELDMPDFEDAMQVGAAIACSANLIATRNVKDFKKSPIKALPPKKILEFV